MADMVERVARAIDPEAWADDMPIPTRADTIGFHRRRQDSARLARAAIEAMREPTGAMVAAFHPAVDVWMDDSTSADEDVWRAMIDAALASEHKP